MRRIISLLLALCLLVSLMGTVAMAETAADLVAMIDAIDGISLENEAAIDAAYYAYYQLPETERVNVTNWDALLSLREELPQLYVVGERQGTNMPWYKFRIGTYNYPSVLWNEEDVKTLAESGLDFVANVSYNDELLTLFEQYGMGAFISARSLGLPLYTYKGLFRTEAEYYPYEPTHTPEDTRVAAEAIKEQVDTHSSIWGIEFEDEPNSVSFNHLGKDIAVVDEIFPQLTSYVNLYPNYAATWQLGTASYERYLNLLHERIDLDYTCLDHYIYQNNRVANAWGLLNNLINNLDILQKVNNEQGKESWMVIQANVDGPNPLLINKLKLQAYLSMAFGAKLINYACYSEASAWWDYQITDAEGNPTQRYYDLQEITADLHALGPVFMRYTGTCTCAIGDIYGAEDAEFDFGHLVTYTGDLEAEYLMAGETFNALNLGIAYDESVYQIPNTQKSWKYKVDKEYLAKNDVTLGQDVFADFAVAEEKAAVLIGHFEKNVGEGSAIMLVNITNHNFNKGVKESRDIELPATVSFTVNKADAVVTVYVKGIPEIIIPVDGVYTVELNAADAAFITVD